MKRKDYEKPTTRVVQLRHKSHILAGSVGGSQATVQDYGWNTEDEE
jgi:hypothetical protein